MLLRALGRLPHQRLLIGRFRTAIERGRPEAAFDAAERLLDLEPTTAIYEELVRPFDRAPSPEVDRRLYDLLRLVETNGAAAHAAWRAFFRVALLDRLGWYEEALRVSVDLTRLPARYGWMRHARAMLFLNNLQAYDAAAAELAAAAQAAPAFWKTRGVLAECVMLQGRDDEAFALMDQCVDAVAPRSAERDEATTWRGELHAWLGRYDAALADFAAGVTHDFPYALIWGGGAHLLLGHADRALALLDRAVRITPRDAEAYVWRGEVHERLGHADLARRDYDQAVMLRGPSLWACVGRALVAASRGDLAAATADYETLPSRTRALFEWRTGTPSPRDPAALVAVLQQMRTAARGLRRSEQYLEPLWCRRES